MHIAYLHTLLEELTSRGLDPAELIAPVPREITAEQLAELLRQAVTLVDDPALALSFGMRLNLANHGTLGYALMSCRNGDQLLNSLTRFARLAVPSLALDRLERGQQLQLQCRFTRPFVARTRLIELIMATLVSGARALFNRRIPGAAVWLDYPAPAHADAYDILKLPVRFNQAHCALVCERSFLGMELPSANPLLAEIGNRQCYDMLREMRQRTGVSEEVRALLLRSASLPNQEGVARARHLSTRTLRRQLQAEGTSYREILDEVRFELAKRYLATRELPVTEVAALLDYEDPANFRRAFKRWSGMTAQQYQASLST